MSLSLSVIIATMNRPDDLNAALTSLLKQTRFPEEVLIIDQSTDARTKDTVEALRASHPAQAPRFRYVHREVKSLVKARNHGISLAAGDILSFLDDDIVLMSDYFENLMRHFESRPDAGAISGNTIIPKPMSGFKWGLRKALWSFFLLNDFRGRMTPSGFGYPIYEREIDGILEVEMLPGCNMSFRKSAMGGELFDEWLTGYSFREDAEYSYRISLKSKVLMVPDAKLYHNYSTSSRLDPATLKRMEIRNYRYVQKKFKKGPVAFMLFLYSLSGIICLDLLELVFNPSSKNWKKFGAAVSSFFSVLAGRGV